VLTVLCPKKFAVDCRCCIPLYFFLANIDHTKVKFTLYMEFWLVVHQSQKSIVYMLLTLVMHPLLECSFLPWENGHTGVDVTIIAFKTHAPAW
jgi:hypothetical protein